MTTLPAQGQWPCLFTASDTTGEKDAEEFFTEHEHLDLQRFDNLGIIKSKPNFDSDLLAAFENKIVQFKQQKSWSKQQLVELFNQTLPEFSHQDTGKYLDGKM